MLLALDTASRVISLALHDGNRVITESTWYSANNHTIELSPAIHKALASNSLHPTDLTAIAVAQGPGSFTGLRIGMGVAKGLVLAQGRRMQLVAVPTLDIVAAGAPVFEGQLAAVLQAGRGRICVQRYQWDAENAWKPIGQAEITAWEQLLDTITIPTLIAGEINDTGRQHLATTSVPVTVAPAAASLRRAGYLAEIGWQRIRAGKTDDPNTVTPIYLHQPGVPHP